VQVVGPHLHQQVVAGQRQRGQPARQEAAGQRVLDGDAQPVTLSAEAPAFDACGSAWKKDPVSGVIGVE
jgi:hypothetical protein